MPKQTKVKVVPASNCQWRWKMDIFRKSSTKEIPQNQITLDVGISKVLSTMSCWNLTKLSVYCYYQQLIKLYCTQRDLIDGPKLLGETQLEGAPAISNWFTRTVLFRLPMMSHAFASCTFLWRRPKMAWWEIWNFFGISTICSRDGKMYI